MLPPPNRGGRGGAGRGEGGRGRGGAGRVAGAAQRMKWSTHDGGTVRVVRLCRTICHPHSPRTLTPAKKSRFSTAKTQPADGHPLMPEGHGKHGQPCKRAGKSEHTPPPRSRSTGFRANSPLLQGGSRSRAPTAITPCSRAPSRWRTSARPTRSRSRAPTSAPPGGLLLPRANRFSRPRGSLSCAATAAL